MDCESPDFVPSVFSHSARDTTGKVARSVSRHLYLAIQSSFVIF